MAGPEEDGPPDGAAASAETAGRKPTRRGPHDPPPRQVLQLPRYGRYVGLLAVVILILITINTLVTKPNGATGVAPGTKAPPFAVPLATANFSGKADADVATRAHEGAAGNVPACQERGAGILNICELYEQAPVVLALFVDRGSCANVLSEMQALKPQFPAVRFAAVSIEGSSGDLRKMTRKRGLSFPVGIDHDGVLAALYKLASCPQVSFIARGGVVRSRALLGSFSPATLRERVAGLSSFGGG